MHRFASTLTQQPFHFSFFFGRFSWISKNITLRHTVRLLLSLNCKKRTKKLFYFFVLHHLLWSDFGSEIGVKIHFKRFPLQRLGGGAKLIFRPEVCTPGRASNKHFLRRCLSSERHTSVWGGKQEETPLCSELPVWEARPQDKLVFVLTSSASSKTNKPDSKHSRWKNTRLSVSRTALF